MTRRDETLDSIRDVKIFQRRKGYRFSVDALLLEDFITLKRFNKGIELGAGSGIISILLAKRFKNINITAVEIQKTLAGLAKKNVSLNGLENRIEIVREDIKRLPEIFSSGEFDIAFSNPPFRKPATGLLSPAEERAVARHELKINLSELISVASYLLKNGGRFFIIYHPFRLVELMNLLQKAQLEPKRMRYIHSRHGAEAKMVLIEAVKGAGPWLKVEPAFYIYEKGVEYTAEMKRIYGE
jgi:tRNA1Val (adenine37-N6)-methyltransferase